MLLELILENDDIIECASTNVSQQEFSTCLNISIKYTYQLPITHKMFEYFKIINHQFQEITDEIDTHQITSILISVDVSLFIDKDTLKKKHYIELGKHHKVLNDTPLVVGYTCKDGTTIIDSLGLDAMTDGLQRLYDDYTSRAIFKRIPEGYREIVKLLPVKVKLIKGD